MIGPFLFVVGEMSWKQSFERNYFLFRLWQLRECENGAELYDDRTTQRIVGQMGLTGWCLH